MNDISFIIYRLIIKKEISNNLIIRFKEDFYTFKKIYREKYLSIKYLIDLD